MRLFFFLFFLFFVLIVRSVQAQDSLTVETLVPHSAVKFSPLHLLSFYPTVEISFEQKVARRVALQAEGGYVLRFMHGNEQFQDKRGFKSKLEVRYYFWGRTDRKKLYYSSLEPYYNAVNFDREAWVEECYDGSCNHLFERLYLYKMEYRESGVSIKAGMIRYLRPRLFFDVNGGFSFRDITYTKPVYISDREGVDSFFDFFEVPNEESRKTISPCFGIRLAYRLK